MLKYFDDDLLDKLFGFCYARTNDSYKAQELCSDIVFSLVKAANTDGEIRNLYSFIWRVARNVHADYSNNKRKYDDTFYIGDDAEDVLQRFAEDKEQEDDSEVLRMVHRRISFLTRAYREVMIMYYIDGLSTAEIANRQGTSEGAVRQRLFSARQKIRSEVEEMTGTYNKPLALDKIDYVIWGTGPPGWGDPRVVCSRMFSKHIIWLCSKAPMSASEIAEELNVPTVYVEEELEILTKGENGSYGLLRKMENGKYAINFILIDKDTVEKFHALYVEQIPQISEIILAHIEKNKDAYLSFPYLNKKIDLNLILWQQIFSLSHAFSDSVEDILAEEYFSQYKTPDRPFSVFGYVYNGKSYGGGWDGVRATNVCEFSEIRLDNIYIFRIKPHFHYGLDVANDPLIQLALQAIDGLAISTLSEEEKEHAAKAIECGYLFRDGDMLYTKILVSLISDSDRLFELSTILCKGFFEKEAKIVAEKIATLIKKEVPEYLLGEWQFANSIANMPVLEPLLKLLLRKVSLPLRIMELVQRVVG